MVPRDLLNRRRALAILLIAVAAAAVAAAVAAGLRARARADDAAPATRVVARVVDGDTIHLTNGDRVRLVQIDAPEVRDGECYAREARAALVDLVPPGSAVRLETDPRLYAYSRGKSPDLDKVDRFGRLLAYVFEDGVNVNLELVREGAAAPWFFGGVRGRYANALLAAAREARAPREGLWRECPQTVLAPAEPVDTEP